MTKYIYVQRDKKLSFFNAPVCLECTPEDYCEIVRRGVGHYDESKKKILNDCEVYHIGTFDDMSGKITLLEPIKLFDYSDFLGGE